MIAYLEAVWAVLLELAPWLLLGAGVAGLLHVALPEGFIHRAFRGRLGVLKAVTLGVPLPLCSCGVIPAGLGLKKDGTSDGASIGFLVATPQTGVDSVLVSASFLGWPFALFKLASAFLLGLVGGLATEAVTPGDREAAAPAPREAKRTWRDALDHALDIVRSIWRWLAFGVLVSAALTVFVPEDAFAGLSAYGGVLAMLAVLAISVPLYVCATASVPIAAALVAGGFPPGAALVFLMAGPATNVATIGAIRKAFGGRALAIYLGTIVLGSVALGWAFDFVLVGELGVHAGEHAHHAGPIAMATAGLLVALMAWFAVDDLRVALRRAPTAGPLELPVDGLTCNGCVRKLEGQLGEAGLTGFSVQRTEGGPHSGVVQLAAGADLARLAELVRAAGFEPITDAAPRVELDVEGLTCNGCVRKLEGKLSGAEGVTGVEVVREEDAPRGHAIVHGAIDLERVRDLVREAGFEPA